VTGDDGFNTEGRAFVGEAGQREDFAGGGHAAQRLESAGSGAVTEEHRGRHHRGFPHRVEDIFLRLVGTVDHGCCFDPVFSGCPPGLSVFIRNNTQYLRQLEICMA
jgi:hypothetical protein